MVGVILVGSFIRLCMSYISQMLAELCLVSHYVANGVGRSFGLQDKIHWRCGLTSL